mmetsp:Transcript_15465/g.25748  ORF Transcript_15465/g.25748 Transcript_15465/m.25748 type:complete len:649 (+) Transcript_15465:44-1990(+)
MLLYLCCVALVGLHAVAAADHSYPQTAQCCDKIDQENELLSCLEKVDYGTKDIAIISYASTDILDYSAYSFGVNSAYAEQNGYELYVLNEAGGSNYEPRDARWNRVKILAEAIDATSGWLNSVDYVVWMDADLIVLDQKFDIRKIIAEYSKSDIIISSERHAETGVANTGCFIMKNSAWSRDFLHDWWNNYDRSEAHDQIFFDKLYKSKLPEVKKHVTILPQDAINSTPPPMLFQTGDNQVLHMMGQPDMLRQEAFMTGFDEVCQAYSEQRPWAPQLGLTQPMLLNMASQFHEQDIRNRLVVLNASFTAPNDSTIATIGGGILSNEQFFATIDAMRESVLQLASFGGADIKVYVRTLRKLIQKRLSIESSKEDVDQYAMLALYNFAAVNGNDMLNHIQDPAEQLEMLDDIKGNIENMLAIIHPETRHVAQELQIRHYISRGEYFLKVADVNSTQQAYLIAEQLFEDPSTEVQNQVILMDIKLGLATSFCMARDIIRVRRGLGYFNQAVDMQETFLGPEEQMKEDHIKLALTYLRQSGCLAKSGQFERALEVLDKSMAISEVHPNRHAASAYLDHSFKLKKSLLASVAEQKVEQAADYSSAASSTSSTVGSNDGNIQGKEASSGSSSSSPPKKKMMRKKKKKSSHSTEL